VLLQVTSLPEVRYLDVGGVEGEAGVRRDALLLLLPLLMVLPFDLEGHMVVIVQIRVAFLMLHPD